MRDAPVMRMIPQECQYFHYRAPVYN
jgi:hypothetical protein